MEVAKFGQAACFGSVVHGSDLRFAKLRAGTYLLHQRSVSQRLQKYPARGSDLRAGCANGLGSTNAGGCLAAESDGDRR